MVNFSWVMLKLLRRSFRGAKLATGERSDEESAFSRSREMQILDSFG